jgi:hypothetical protein
VFTSKPAAQDRPASIEGRTNPMTLRRNAFALLLVVAAPAAAMAQQDPAERLLEVLPPDVATQVVEIVEGARARGLPDQALANLALEGVAKGRSGEEVRAAVQTMLADMGRADEALRAGGRAPEAGEVEAATTAMRMGADGSAIRALARTERPGANLAVPMMVLGTLAERGLPSDAALAQVRERLASMEGGPGGMQADRPAGGMPEGVGPDFAPGLAGRQIPVPGLTVPVGPPEGRGRPGGLPAPARPGGKGQPQGPPGG